MSATVHASFAIREVTTKQGVDDIALSQQVRKFIGPAVCFRLPDAVERFAIGRVWEEGDEYDGMETVRAEKLDHPGGMRELVLDLELPGANATPDGDGVRELPTREMESSTGDGERRVRYFYGPAATIEADTWQEAGSEAADMPGFRVERKVSRRRGAQAHATVFYSNLIADTASTTGADVGQLELKWEKTQERIHKHPDFSGLTYDELVQSKDYVEGDTSLWADVDHDDGDTPTVQKQKKLARLLIAGFDTFVRFRPVVRQTIPLPDAPDADLADPTLLSGYQAGLYDDPPLRATRPDGSEYDWTREADEYSRSSDGRRYRIREWRGTVGRQIVEGETIIEEEL